MLNHKIISFHINNVKEDFALAFRYLMRGINDFKESTWNEWLESHVFFSAMNSNNNPSYKEIVAYYEKHYDERISWEMSSMQAEHEYADIFYYFRVIVSDDDDILNLHYFFLTNKIRRQNCCIGIIADGKGMAFKISDYLFFETLSWDEKNQLTIDHTSKGRKGNADFQFKLNNNKNEEIFLLSETNPRVPKSLNRKGIFSSNTFFPQMRVNKDLFFIFSKNAETFCQNILEGLDADSEKYDIYLKDLLFEIAINEIVINKKSDLPITKEDILSQTPNVTFSAKSTVMTQLLVYCKNCCKKIIGSSRKKGEVLKENLRNILNFERQNSSVLSICFFLSFLANIEEMEKNTANWIDILTDSQDYASGTLQLMENIIKHVPDKEGIFCFRLHKRLNNEGTEVNTKLSSRYSILSDRTNEYFWEILISDYNEMRDIPEKFKENIKQDYETNNESEKEYLVSESFLNAINNFKLKDLFDYENKQSTKEAWGEFYSASQNLISHYGLLMFEHLVKFAKGAFHVYSSKEFDVLPTQCYRSDSSEYTEAVPHIPGTQYEILLPIGINHTPLETGLFHEIESYLTAPMQNGFEIIHINEKIFDELSGDKFMSDLNGSISYKTLRPYWKTKTANKICDSFIDEIVRTKVSRYEFIECDVRNINNMHAAEVFVKSFINVLFSSKVKEIKYFSLRNANKVFLVTFIRVFSILYMKSGQRKIMNERFIYLCSNSSPEEVFFVGNSLRNSFFLSKRIMARTGMNYHSLQILQREAEKANESETKMDVSCLSMLPISHEFFKEQAFRNLKNDIQDVNFGCCMKNTHMRIGSKIHIHGNYYEASLLFGLNGFVSHFAYHVANNAAPAIKEEIKNGQKKFIIVSYETYSENLAIRVKEYLQHLVCKSNEDVDIDYIIYNDSFSDKKFYRWEEVKPDINSKYIIIVPIGSTLTTNDKISADLFRTNLNDSGEKPCAKSILMHFVLVLVRDNKQNMEPKNADESALSDIEREFWDDISFKSEKEKNANLIIKYKKSMANIGAENLIHCYLAVDNEWLLPNKCKYCFPPHDKLTDEKPLILPNRTSVVPMTSIGLNSDNLIASSIEECARNDTDIMDDIRDLDPLKKGLCYGHIVRNGENHFEYYFSTDKVMDAIIGSDGHSQRFINRLNEWTNKRRKEMYTNCFDYIVAPLHDTNAKFVYYINNFLRANQIIWIDTKKDFRNNIVTKYSNVTALLKNCQQRIQSQNNSKERFAIRFHFVDDTINSGTSFYRAKSLITSLIPESIANDQHIDVTVFEDVFVLLNRCSPETQKKYIDNPDADFHALMDLNISVMRNYGDACVPCKNGHILSDEIPKYSSTTQLALYSLHKAKKYILRNSEEINSPEKMILPGDANIISRLSDLTEQKQEIEKHRTRAYCRMIMTHRINNALSKAKMRSNDSDFVESVLIQQLVDVLNVPDSSLKIDLFFSTIKVMSRPFLSFKKSVSEAALKVILHIAEFTFFKRRKEDKKYDKIYGFILGLMNDASTQICFVRVVLSGLTNLRSTYLVRTSTIEALLELCKELASANEVQKLISSYEFYVKSMLCSGDKNTLSLWLEKMFKGDILKEPGCDEKSQGVDVSKYANGKNLKQMLLLENIIPICSALEQCNKAWNRKNYEPKDLDEVIKDTLSHYYCRIYCELCDLSWNKTEGKFDDKFIEHCEETFAPMLKLYKHLVGTDSKPTSNNAEMEYYEQLLDMVGIILGTEKPMLFVKNPNAGKNAEEYDGLFLLFPLLAQNNSNGYYNRLFEFVNKVSENHLDGVVALGETLYYTQNDTNCICAVKIVNTNNEDDNIVNTNNEDDNIVNTNNEDNNIVSTKNENNNMEMSMYFLAFEWDSYIDETDIILKARNLLSMRSMLMKRIASDFDNHIRNDFIKLRNEVISLSIDRSGSHSPFGELKDLFFDTVKLINRNTSIDESGTLYSGYMKLVTDSIISKWYVHSIAQTFPEYFHPEQIRTDSPIPLKQYKELFLLLLKGKTLSSHGATKISSDKSQIYIDWEHEKFMCPVNCGYIWCCAFIALYYNALNHGYGKKKGTKWEVDVCVTSDDDFVYFKNKMQSCEGIDLLSDDPNRRSVTLNALKYYFDNYYGHDLFIYDIVPSEEGRVFSVRIPKNIKKGRKDE